MDKLGIELAGKAREGTACQSYQGTKRAHEGGDTQVEGVLLEAKATVSAEKRESSRRVRGGAMRGRRGRGGGRGRGLFRWHLFRLTPFRWPRFHLTPFRWRRNDGMRNGAMYKS